MAELGATGGPTTVRASNRQLTSLRAGVLSTWVHTFIKFMPVADVRALESTAAASHWTLTHDQLFGDEHGLQKGTDHPALFRNQDRGIPKTLGVTSQQCSTAIVRAGLLKSKEIVQSRCPYRTRGPNASGSKFNVGIVYDASPPEQLLQAFRQSKAELEKFIGVRTELIARRRKTAECKSDPNSVYTEDSDPNSVYTEDALHDVCARPHRAHTHT